MAPQFTFGNLEGRNYTRWRIDELMEIAKEIWLRVQRATDFHIWYDADEDFHNLKFKIDTNEFEVRYYKVFALMINKERNPSWPYLRSDQFDLINKVVQTAKTPAIS